MNRATLSPWTTTRFASPPMLDVGFDQASRPTTYNKRYIERPRFGFAPRCQPGHRYAPRPLRELGALRLRALGLVFHRWVNGLKPPREAR
jgi:hypothetical protein